MGAVTSQNDTIFARACSRRPLPPVGLGLDEAAMERKLAAQAKVAAAAAASLPSSTTRFDDPARFVPWPAPPAPSERVEAPAVEQAAERAHEVRLILGWCL